MFETEDVNGPTVLEGDFVGRYENGLLQQCADVDLQWVRDRVEGDVEVEGGVSPEMVEVGAHGEMVVTTSQPQVSVVCVYILLLGEAKKQKKQAVFVIYSFMIEKTKC